MKRIGRLLALVVGLAFAQAAPASTPAVYPKKEVFRQLEIFEQTHLDQTGLRDQLVGRFAEKDTYSADEMLAVMFPKVTDPKNETVKLPQEQRPEQGPPGSISRAEAQEQFQLLTKNDPKSEGTLAALDLRYGNEGRPQPWFYVSELVIVEKNGVEYPPHLVPRPPTPTVKKAEAYAKEVKPKIPFLEGFKTPLIRRDWTDVLLIEDRSQQGSPIKKMPAKVDDLVGASFSYAYDAKADSTTWSSVGAVILPWFWETGVQAGLTPFQVTLAPSISVNRISTNGTPVNETDQLFYRLGIFAESYKPLGGSVIAPTDLTLRAAGVYGTNTGHDASMPGFEVDLEPRFAFNNSLTRKFPLKIGYQNILWPKAPTKPDDSDQSYLDYQLRVWLHAEGGDVQDTGKTFAAATGTFYRLGPTVQLRANAPLLLRGVSFTGFYSYLPTLAGHKGNDSLLKLDLTVNLLPDNPQHRKIALNADYTRGGLDFTKQDVDTFTLGLSVLY